MPTRNVNLTDELDHFVLQKVESYSTSAFIPFALGVKSRPSAISASLKIVANSFPTISRSVASVMKFALGYGA